MPHVTGVRKKVDFVTCHNKGYFFSSPIVRAFLLFQTCIFFEFLQFFYDFGDVTSNAFGCIVQAVQIQTTGIGAATYIVVLSVWGFYIRNYSEQPDKVNIALTETVLLACGILIPLISIIVPISLGVVGPTKSGFCWIDTSTQLGENARLAMYYILLWTCIIIAISLIAIAIFNSVIHQMDHLETKKHDDHHHDDDEEHHHHEAVKPLFFTNYSTSVLAYGIPIVYLLSWSMPLLIRLIRLSKLTLPPFFHLIEVVTYGAMGIYVTLVFLISEFADCECLRRCCKKKSKHHKETQGNDEYTLLDADTSRFEEKMDSSPAMELHHRGREDATPLRQHDSMVIHQEKKTLGEETGTFADTIHAVYEIELNQPYFVTYSENHLYITLSRNLDTLVFEIGLNEKGKCFDPRMQQWKFDSKGQMRSCIDESLLVVAKNSQVFVVDEKNIDPLDFGISTEWKVVFTTPDNSKTRHKYICMAKNRSLVLDITKKKEEELLELKMLKDTDGVKQKWLLHKM